LRKIVKQFENGVTLLGIIDALAVGKDVSVERDLQTSPS
jgi:hypothetical protein